VGVSPTNITAGAYLVVWASGRDRRVPGKPLHTNFKLDGNGESLALIAPDHVTVVNQYAFGEQILDRTYGLQPDVVDSVAVVPKGAAARYFVPTDDSLANRWTSPDFDDAGWRAGTTGFGFDLNAGSAFSPWISTDVKDLLAGASPQRSGLFIRIPFVVDDLKALANLTLQVRYDDGFVAYLNGSEIARRGIGAKTVLSFSTTSTLTRSNEVAVLPEDFPSLALTQTVRAGTNLLAIHAFNREPGDTDFLIVPEILSRRLRYPTNATRYFATPSPGFANSIGYAGVSGDLQFSAKSRTFLKVSNWQLHPVRLRRWRRFATPWTGWCRRQTLFSIQALCRLPTACSFEPVSSNRDSCRAWCVPRLTRGSRRRCRRFLLICL
jgi:hypothetical protein